MGAKYKRQTKFGSSTDEIFKTITRIYKIRPLKNDYIRE
jgi:hypothetical protein